MGQILLALLKGDGITEMCSMQCHEVEVGCERLEAFREETAENIPSFLPGLAL